MTIAYLILAHDKPGRLVQRLDTDNVQFTFTSMPRWTRPPGVRA
jgi:hypothetical protein